MGSHEDEEVNSRDIDLGDPDSIKEQLVEDGTVIHATISVAVAQAHDAGVIGDDEVADASNSIFNVIVETSQSSQSKEEYEANMQDAFKDPVDQGIMDDDVAVTLVNCSSDMLELLLQSGAEVGPFMDNLQAVCNEVGDQGGDEGQFKEAFEPSFDL